MKGNIVVKESSTKRERQVAKLKKWMAEHQPRLLAYHLSRRINEWPSTIHRILEDGIAPNPKLAKKIETFTKGVITFEGWY